MIFSKVHLDLSGIDSECLEQCQKIYVYIDISMPEWIMGIEFAMSLTPSNGESYSFYFMKIGQPHHGSQSSCGLAYSSPNTLTARVLTAGIGN